jgi:phage repressor protein C with HTH and peptisase S24 domain
VSWPFAIYRIEGDSMLPKYAHGDTLLGLKLFRPQVGQVVVANGPDRKLIKRITKHTESSSFIEGDNREHSTDSRVFGHLPDSQLEAWIILKL